MKIKILNNSQRKAIKILQKKMSLKIMMKIKAKNQKEIDLKIKPSKADFNK